MALAEVAALQSHGALLISGFPENTVNFFERIQARQLLLAQKYEPRFMAFKESVGHHCDARNTTASQHRIVQLAHWYPPRHGVVQGSLLGLEIDDSTSRSV